MKVIILVKKNTNMDLKYFSNNQKSLSSNHAKTDNKRGD